MSRRLAALTPDTLADLPAPCRGCVFWELDPAAGGQLREPIAATAGKQAWVSDTLLQWGSCGQLIYVDGTPVGYVLYAPPAYVPRARSFATSPPADDAVLLTAAYVVPEFAGGGLGRMLVQGMVGDLARRGVRAIEAFGAHRPTACLLPADYLLRVGFTTVRSHPSTPRLRLDVRSTLSWRGDVESALDRVRASWHRPVLAP